MESFKGCLYLLCAFTLAGSSVISARVVSDKLGIFTITTLSLAFAFLFLLSICWKKLKGAFRDLSISRMTMIILQAFFGIFLFRLLLLRGLGMTSASEAGIMTGATPAITALLAAVFLREPVSKKGLIGIMSTCFGILLIQGVLSSNTVFLHGHLIGNLLVLGAAACESLFNVLSRSAALKGSSQGKPMDPIIQTTLVTFVALLFCFMLSLFENPIPAVLTIGTKEWLALLWYGVFVTAIAFMAWYSGIKRCSASAAAAFSGMMPFTSLILSVLILGEKAGWREWTGGLLVITGMILIGMRQSEKKNRNKSLSVIASSD